MPCEIRFKYVCLVAVSIALNPTIYRWKARKDSFRSGDLAIKAAKPNDFIRTLCIARRRPRDSPAGDSQSSV